MAECVCESNGFSGSIGIKAVTAKSGAGTLRGWYIFNPTAALVYVNVYDAKDDAKVQVGIATPLLSLGVPAGGGANVIAERIRDFSEGIVVNASTLRGGSVAPTATVDVNFFF